VLADLMGHKLLFPQVMYSRFEADLFFEYHRHCAILVPEGSLEFEEAKYWHRRTLDLGIEAAREGQKLFNTLGLVGVLFEKSGQMDHLRKTLYDFKSPKVSPPGRELSLPIVNEWKKRGEEELEKAVEVKFRTPIANLVTYLEAELARDPSR